MNNETLPAGEPRETSPTGSKKISREELEILTSQLIRRLHRRSTAARFKPARDTDPTRLQYARATIAAVQAYTALLKDTELAELEKRITELEKVRLRE